MAVVGIGQVLCGDDGLGPAVVRLLQQSVPHDECLLIVDAGHAPENVLGVIIQFRPDLVLFVDAIRMESNPGQIAILDGSVAGGSGGSTHTIPLGLLSTFITNETNALTYIVGIQPATVGFGEDITPIVSVAIELVVDWIRSYWRNAAAACSAIRTGDISVVST